MKVQDRLIEIHQVFAKKKIRLDTFLTECFTYCAVVQGLQAYEDTDFKQYWMPDSVSKECYDCGEKFTTFRRRHHCRVCGQIFCSRCCNQEIPGKIMGCTGTRPFLSLAIILNHCYQSAFHDIILDL